MVKIKRALRNWLGIDNLEETLNQRPYPTNAQFRKMVGEAVDAALNGHDDTDRSPWGWSQSVPNTLTRALKLASVETATNCVKSEIEKRICNEAFIDEVIERIRRKQIGA